MRNDKMYWEKFYEHERTPFLPSPFAQHVHQHYVKENDFLIELGCGNGRDAVYFANKGVRTLAFDQCETEIDFLARTYPLDNLQFKTRDFTSLKLKETVKCNHVYSRFTIHSIYKDKQNAVLQWAFNMLLDGGYLLIEVRGKNNELYKMGEPVSSQQDAYIYQNHFRRFIDFEKICTELNSIGFELLEAKEEKGFSPFQGTDETFIRLIAKK